MPHEFDTTTLLTQAFADSKRVFLPRVVSKKEKLMVMLECESMEELQSWTPNSWNIREPPLEDGRLQTPRDAHVDVVIVPGVAFEVGGSRCGQGMGFYDRFLASFGASSHPMPRLVALALHVQVIDSVPVTADDWTIDEVLYSRTKCAP